MPAPRRQRAFAGFDAPEPSGGPPARSRPTEDSQPPGAPPGGAGALRGRTVYIFDAHSLIYQVFHAMPALSSPTGQPVGAVHGFTRDVLEILERDPDYVFCAFDPPGPTFRHSLYDRYKWTREEMPDDLRPQIGSIRRMLEALGVPVLECPGFEADDVLATMARVVREQGGECYLVSGDKDCRQLIGRQVKLFNIRKGQVFDEQALEREWGIRPEQVVDFQALVGDASDNVPGVPLIGPKIASQLLAEYQTLEGVLDHAHQVRGQKRRENLQAAREQAMLSRELVRLDAHVPIEIDWTAGQVGPIDMPAVTALCREFGFRQLAERIARLAPAASVSSTAWQAQYELVADPRQLDALVDQLRRQPRIAVDTETTSRHPCWAELVGLSFAWRAGRAYYVPVRAPAGQPRLELAQVVERLGPVLADPAIAKVGQNLKYDRIVLRRAGIELAGAAFDTMLADYLLDPGQRQHDLDELARRHLNYNKIRFEELVGSGRRQIPVDQVPLDKMTRYAGEDADATLRLSDVLGRRLAEEGLEPLFRELEMPLVEVLAELEYRGIRVDAQRLGELSARFSQRLAAVEQEIYAAAGGEPFNIDSRQQLATVLFERLGLPTVKRTKTGPSTDIEVLEQLALVHPLPAKIIEYRELAKLKGTYVDALPKLVHPDTGRVHTSFNQVVAATGRLSSADPNLQNIPIRTEIGREIRSAFQPDPPGWLLLAADYSQIELRVLAHVSGDAKLQEAFGQDEDIHARVASEVYGVARDQVTSAMRRSAKAINFGIVYGQSPYGLARTLGITPPEASRFIEAYFDQYEGVGQFIRATLADCREKGYVSTVLGRRRAVQGVRDPSTLGNSRQRNLPERIAINTVIQGSAADLIKQAMLRIHGRLKQDKLRARMLLQIHDELVFEVPSDELPRLIELVRWGMAGAGRLSVPLKVDLKAGANWAECEPWT